MPKNYGSHDTTTDSDYSSSSSSDCDVKVKDFNVQKKKKKDSDGKEKFVEMKTRMRGKSKVYRHKLDGARMQHRKRKRLKNFPRTSTGLNTSFPKLNQ